MAQGTEDGQYWLLQVFTKTAWDCAFFVRRPGDKKGAASFVDSSPKLQWMNGKAFPAIWAHLLEQKRLGRLGFSFSEENDRLMKDLLARPSERRAGRRRV